MAGKGRGEGIKLPTCKGRGGGKDRGGARGSGGGKEWMGRARQRDIAPRSYGG